MATGLLELRGTIELSQFWPKGTSDADTTKVIVSVDADAFRFRRTPESDFRVTQVFRDATVVGSIRTAAIKNGKVTVRLQGIDAPELHYRPKAHLRKADQSEEQHELYLKWNEEYRQCLAETSTLSLLSVLQELGSDSLPCRVLTAVDEPGEAFDTYGRLVGDLLVDDGRNEFNVNHWLVNEGHAFPAFYTSMSPEEITRLTDAANGAWSDGKGIWPYLVDSVEFDRTLLFRGKDALPSPDEDLGPVILPKIYRRLCAWWVNRKAKMFTSTFRKYIASKPDTYCLTEEFLVQGATASRQYPLETIFDDNGNVSLWPEEMVFQESPSRVIGPGGESVTW